MTDFLTIGIILGISAGCAPGPLLMLVISETLQHGIRSGIKVALAPVISDLPIILLTVYIVSKLAGFQTGLGVISLAGGLFILLSGCSCLRTQPVTAAIATEQPRSLLKGLAVNVLNPHPYLFWISVGTPLMSKALTAGIPALCGFLAGFYCSLVGSKIFLALAVGKSRSFLSGKMYLYTLRFLGLLLLVFALFLFRDGAKLIGLIE